MTGIVAAGGAARMMVSTRFTRHLELLLLRLIGHGGVVQAASSEIVDAVPGSELLAEDPSRRMPEMWG